MKKLARRILVPVVQAIVIKVVFDQVNKYLDKRENRETEEKASSKVSTDDVNTDTDLDKK